MEEPKKNNALLWAVAVVVIALIAYAGYKYSNKNSSALTDTTKVLPPSATIDDTPDPGNDGRPMSGDMSGMETGTFKDGTYTATGDYNSPGGAEQIKVTLTLKDEVVTDATVVSLATRPESKLHQKEFIAGYKTQVIGKKITDISITKVSGSSLSPKGFMDALAKIEAQASA